MHKIQRMHETRRMHETWKQNAQDTGDMMNAQLRNTENELETGNAEDTDNA